MAESVVVLEDQLHNSHKFFCHMCSVEIENVSAVSTKHYLIIMQLSHLNFHRLNLTPILRCWLINHSRKFN